MKILSAIAVSLAMLVVIPASATEYSDAVGSCLSDSTNGKDRKALARWTFVSMAAHPEIRSMFTVTNNIQDDVNKEMGNLVTRLVAENCAKEFRALHKHDSSQGFITAFEFLGRVAMQEIMTHPAVSSSTSGFEKYLDKAKIQAVFVSQ